MIQREILPVIAVAVIAVCIAACANAPSANSQQAQKEPPGTPITLSADQMKQIQAGVRESLKDPDSAKFSGPVVAAKRLNGDITACGTVNAKNSYGGYVGASPFFATVRNGKVIDSVASGGSDAQFITQMCREAGVPF